MSYKILEDEWTEDFKYFLIDEGCIQYSFKELDVAVEFKRNGKLDYMFLTDLDNITYDTMLDPMEFRSWANKTQSCVLAV